MPVQRASAAEQIANELRAQIEAGEFKPGETLPSDSQLARRFGVSKPTVTYFPGDLAESCPALLEAERIEQGTTLYVEQQTGRGPSSIASSVWCQAGGSGPGSDAEQLDLAPRTYLLAVSTTTYDDAGGV